ncbi:MAG: hypothetical protein K6B43_08115 [Treponema sp.]|nr:hypothetical protein [Treponema sp.]
MAIADIVDKIRENRKKEIEKFASEREKIAKIRDCLGSVKSFLASAGDVEFLDRINQVDGRLREASEIFESLKKRFERDTINIGVAGRTHAGKSTLLKTLSGLSEDEIPTADGKTEFRAMPTTAVHSQIFNAAEKKAVITFHTRDSFYEKRVKPYLRHFKTIPIHSISDFESFDFSRLNVDESEDKKAEAQADLERLCEISESYKYFSGFIGSGSKILSGANFSELKNYVSYSYGSPEKRFYPAVDNVKIYSPFNLASYLKDVKVGLIDLPGFGEATAEVDKILLDGIKNDVDCTVLIFPTNNGVFIGADEIQSFDSISGAQPGIKDKTNFISFIVNKTLDPKGDAQSIHRGIETNFDRTAPCPFKVFDCSVKHENEVCDVFSEIIKRLADTLPLMDNEILEYFKAKLSFDEINQLISDIKRTYEKNWKSIGLDADERRKLGKDIQEKIAKGTNKLLVEMRKNIDDESLKKDFQDEVEKIKDKIKDLIDNGLFKKSKESWSEYISDEDIVKGGILAVEQSECHRLRTEIVKCYEQLDKYYKHRLDEFRTRIGAIFKDATGNFMVETNPERPIDEIIRKLSDCDIDFPFMTEAFKFLQSLKIEFRQFIYPYLYKTNALVPLDPRVSGAGFPDFPRFKGEKKEQYELLRQHLEIRAIRINKVIEENVLTNNTTEEYIYSGLDHFDEILIRNDEEGVTSDYTNFADYFYDEINSAKSTGQNWKELGKLLKNLAKAIS